MAFFWPGAGDWMGGFLLLGRSRCFCDMLVWLFRSETAGESPKKNGVRVADFVLGRSGL